MEKQYMPSTLLQICLFYVLYILMRNVRIHHAEYILGPILREDNYSLLKTHKFTAISSITFNLTETKVFVLHLIIRVSMNSGICWSEQESFSAHLPLPSGYVRRIRWTNKFNSVDSCQKSNVHEEHNLGEDL